MAALDFFLELEPLGEPGVSPAPAPPACGSPSDASADTAVAAWAFKAPHAAKPQLPQKRQRQLDAYSTDEEEEPEAQPELSTSPGCSYSAPAGLAAGLLDLEDDACSAPALRHAAAAAQQQQAAQQWQQQQQARGAAAVAAVLPDGVPLVAATFFDDLAAGGSVWRYCTQQRH